MEMPISLNIILAIVILLVALIIKIYIEKNLRKSAEEDPEGLRKKIRNINIVRLILMLGLMFFFVNNIVKDWKMGEINYSNLMVVVVLIICTIVVFWKRFKNNTL